MENNIGEARRNYQIKNGKFTQSDAAKFFGVSLSTYKKWEQGQGMMNGEQLREIAMKYDTTVDYLLGVAPSINYAVVDLSEDDELTSDERKLLKYYRQLPSNSKETVLHLAKAEWLHYVFESGGEEALAAEGYKLRKTSSEK